MKAIRFAAVAAVALAFGLGSPAMAASEYPFEPGQYVEVSGISIDDGHDLDYARHLAGMWRKGQDYAKAQGWIAGYEILYNVYKRKGEPDVYLLTRFTTFADKAEEQRRDEAYRAYMQQTDTQAQAAAGQRATYRHLSGSMLLRSMDWKK
jgi:hypothetical protein